MFPPKKCITIWYSIILLHVVSSAFGMQLHGVWIVKGDRKLVRMTDLLNGPCKNLLDERLEQLSRLGLTPYFEAVSMVYLKPEVDKDMDNNERMGVAVVKDSTLPQGDGHEGHYFTMVFDYLNLEGGNINDEARLSLARKIVQELAVYSSLQLAQKGAQTYLAKCDVIKRNRPLGRFLKKKFNQAMSTSSRSATSTSDQGSSSGASETKNSSQPSQQQQQQSPSSLLESVQLQE